MVMVLTLHQEQIKAKIIPNFLSNQSCEMPSLFLHPYFLGLQLLQLSLKEFTAPGLAETLPSIHHAIQLPYHLIYDCPLSTVGRPADSLEGRYQGIRNIVVTKVFADININ